VYPPGEGSRGAAAASDDIRRFRWEGNLTTLREFLTEILACDIRNARLSWLDEEGDWIVFDSEEEWKECLRAAGKGVLRIKVELSHPLSSTAPKPQILSSSSSRTSKRYASFPKYKKISSPISNIKKHYDIVVVGSGYGAAIAACRMSRLGKRVCVLERGTEKTPGEYPNTPQQAASDFRLTLPDGSVYGKRTGFFDWTLSKNVWIWKGCGLGGGSLVNSNVSIKPDARVYDSWPSGIRNDLATLEKGFQMAEEVLCPNPYPNQATKPLTKLAALHKASLGNGGTPAQPANVNVSFVDRVNDQGIQQYACKLCGDCNSGCNYGAKNTLLMNYLPDAKNHGAEMYCQVDVQSVQQTPTSPVLWQVNCLILADDSGSLLAEPKALTVTADIVMLGAGSIGSTEILLRSKKLGLLQLSDALGMKFGADGDFFGFSYNGPDHINSIGYGNNDYQEMYSKEGLVGPCISGVWDLRSPQQPVEEGLIIEDMTIPGCFAPLLSSLFPLGAALFGENTDPSSSELLDGLRIVQSLLEGPYTGATRNTLMMGGMGHDNQSGRMFLDQSTDGICFDWPTAVDPKQNEQRNKIFKKAVTNLRATFMKDPLASPLWWVPGVQRAEGIVHPLGGCIMSEDVSTGVVNHKGQVWRKTDTDGVVCISSHQQQQEPLVYEGLYVCDGAVIPTSVGVNPLWTISAVAERICILIAKERGWLDESNWADYASPAGPRTRAGLKGKQAATGSSKGDTLLDW
jgi:cholesterol oxidase